MTTQVTTTWGTLRTTRGLSAFAAIVVLVPLLLLAAALGIRAQAASGDTGLLMSSLSGTITSADPRWGVVSGSEVAAIDGTAVEGGATALRGALLGVRPGPLTVRFRRDRAEWDVAGAAVARPWSQTAVYALRIVTAALLFAVSAVVFVMRPGHRVSWLFFAFGTALCVHLSGYYALFRHPPEGIVVEYLGVYLAAALGVHLFAIFPRDLLRRRWWIAPLYLPFAIAAVVLPLTYRSPAGIGLATSIVLVALPFAAFTGLVSVILVVMQYRRAAREDDVQARARARCLLVGVLVGLALPGLMGAIRTNRSALDPAINSFLVIVFVLMTAYAIVRLNAFDVDRFTAAVVGYGATLSLLAAGFGALLFAGSTLAGRELGSSPEAVALSTVALFLVFNPAYRRVRRRVDRAFFRDRGEEDTGLARLRQLTEVVRGAAPKDAFRAAIDTAGTLHPAEVQVWQVSPTGDYECVDSEGGDPEAVPAALAVGAALLQALEQGSGGVAGMTDTPFDEAAQQELWERGLVLAAPMKISGHLRGFIGLGRKRSGTAYTARERDFIDTVATHLSLAIDRGATRRVRVGPYRLLRRLGTGGMAEVYLAEKQGPGGFELRVAIKRLHPHLSRHPDAVAMFLDEARIAAQLRHPNIVQIHNIEEIDGTHAIAMEYMDGPTVDELIDHAAESNGKLPVPVALAIGDALLSALQYAHERVGRDGEALGLIHRDVKPANLLTSKQGEIKLADFGIARAEFRLHQTVPGLAKGTLPYMAPEQQTQGSIDQRADLYSATAVIYELLTGRRAYPEGPLRGEPAPVTIIDRHLPAALDTFIERGLAREPADRFASAAEMRAALHNESQPFVAATTAEIAALVAEVIAAADSGAADPFDRSLTEASEDGTATHALRAEPEPDPD